MIETTPHIEFIIGDEKRLAEIVTKAEIEPLLRSALKLGIRRVSLLDEDEATLVRVEQSALPDDGELVRQRLSIQVEGEPKGTLLLEAVEASQPFEMIGRLLQDALQLTVTNNLKRMLTTEVHTSVVQESYDQLVATNRRLMESERRYRDLARDLETKVVERTAELQQAYERMLQQEKLAAVGQLAAGMAHEINTPLGFIRSNLTSFGKYQHRIAEMLMLYQTLMEHEADLAADRQQAEQRRKDLKIDYLLEDSDLLLKQSLEGADRIATIVAELKGFAHLDGMEQREMDIRRELEQLLAGFASQLPPNTRLCTDLQPLPPLLCRVPLMIQAFANILDNAVKSRTERLELNVSTAIESECIVIRIGDNGCGIAPEHLSHVFEPFFSTRQVGSGSGMGLTVAHQAITAVDGSIEVVSELDRGTVVTVRIPLT